MGFSVEHGTPAVDALAPFIAAMSQAAVDAAFDYVTQAMGNVGPVGRSWQIYARYSYSGRYGMVRLCALYGWGIVYLRVYGKGYISIGDWRAGGLDTGGFVRDVRLM